ncbi:MAG: hypothetical protein ACLFP4_09495 [Spirochaetales bacterium]
MAAREAYLVVARELVDQDKLDRQSIQVLNEVVWLSVLLGFEQSASFYTDQVKRASRELGERLEDMIFQASRTGLMVGEAFPDVPLLAGDDAISTATLEGKPYVVHLWRPQLQPTSMTDNRGGVPVDVIRVIDDLSLLGTLHQSLMVSGHSIPFISIQTADARATWQSDLLRARIRPWLFGALLT